MQLKAITKVVADTADIHAIRRYQAVEVLLQIQTIPSTIRSPTYISSFTDKVFWPPFPQRCDSSGCSIDQSDDAVQSLLLCPSNTGKY